ncbi:polyribonucleotide nucleotidyltransferase [Thermodesulfomicrobium sp. WS]|uniref:polyribonucleotide nucleotidyltransferase n=1 Tax=Thermodesulfomicrobium sp. WS TaxID=3004129 RepID=UPI002492A7E8|nr:polyribonucleotide nucleotidyltransferase [Thermodesulfomicrobium sp. WS]BDV01861.1 polyribonucleotide nucleotidyltransferase [Thermodesulfomicrobium sp. WS]
MSGFSTTTRTISWADGSITIEHGRLALQASGAVTVRWGDTIVLVTATHQALDRAVDFLPLTCNYQEMLYAAGRIPGSYFRREIGRPSDHETLISRLVDRPIRPLFPKTINHEIQIIATVISSDREHPADILAMLGASAALHISDIPFAGPMAAVRIGQKDGAFILNPTTKEMAASTLNLVLAGTRDAVVMVEGGAQFIREDVLAEAIAWGHSQLAPFLDAQESLREERGRAKFVVPEAVHDAELEAAVREVAIAPLDEALRVPTKLARKEAKAAAKETILAALRERFAETPERLARVGEILEALEKELVRRRILEEGRRIDGRDLTTVRPLTMEVGVLPRTHGSAIFARGETKALCTCTLGSSRDEQRLETLGGDVAKRFLMHYNFPPYCVGEARPLRAPSRREVGHGALSERALAPILPDPHSFPFTIRLVSDIMESNGSSSMASVCGGCLALMDAGVPITTPVAGIAMGLIKEGDRYLVLTDILGDEDHLGDMDFKVAGSRDGVTAIQMDIKIAGIPAEVMRQALAQAREARIFILDAMAKVLPAPRGELSRFAPQTDTVHISPDKIRELIGPGGKNIKAICEATQADIDIDDSGKVSIFAPDQETLAKAREMVLFYDQKAELGRDYDGIVKKVMDFGAFVEILPGLEGLCHISQLDRARVQTVTDVVREGDAIRVRVIDIEPSGRIKLSRKAILQEAAGEAPDPVERQAPRSGGRPRGGGRR